MISKLPRPFVFVHIPKNAGTSIEKALLRPATGCDDFHDLTLLQKKRHHLPMNGAAIQHDKFRRYESLYSLEGYVTFSIVRNPFDRAVSQIRYLRKASQKGRELFSGSCWKDWLMALSTANCWIHGHDLGADQTAYLIDEKGDLTLDYIGDFEDVGATWAAIKNLLNVYDDLELPHIFRAEEIDYRDCFDSESLEAISKKYGNDLKDLDYCFERRERNPTNII